MSRRGRITGRTRWPWLLLLALAGAVAAPLLAERLDGIAGATAAFVDGTNPRANYWRAVRREVEGYSAIKGPERGELIENGGQVWRQIRNGWVATFAPMILGAALVLIAAFYVVRGRIRVEEALSGEKVRRWRFTERVVHWYTAILFIALAVTGLSLLLGRAALIPLVGQGAFAAYAQWAMWLHNFTGPLFAVGIAAMIVLWLKDNIPTRVDLEWFRRAGGMRRGGPHASAGRMNAGEKTWFWLIATVGVVVIASGFVLDFPNFQQERDTMQVANVVHASLAILWIAVAFGHIYIGTLGTEGAFEGMATGEVSVEWARQHHDLWYEAVQREGGGAVEAAPSETPSPQPEPGG